MTLIKQVNKKYKDPWCSGKGEDHRFICSWMKRPKIMFKAKLRYL